MAETEAGLNDGADEDVIEDLSGQGLIKEEHFDLYLRWLRFGGAKRGLSPQELIDMPADLTADFLWLQGRYNRELQRAHKIKQEKRA